jgi:hypothetical protein
MALLLVLAALLFVQPKIEPAKPGLAQDRGNYVIAVEGAFRIAKGVVQRPPKKFHPAFLFSSEDNFRVAVKAVEAGGVTVLSADAGKIQIRYSDGFVVRKGSAATLRAMHEIESASAVTVSPGGDEYLLIRWRGDGSSCELGFTLFKIDEDAMKEIGQNAYGCDV